MTNQRNIFSIQAQKVSSLVDYLDDRHLSICGPRTLNQAYADFWMLVMSSARSLTDQEYKVIQGMAPLKVDWAIAYAWWKDRIA